MVSGAGGDDDDVEVVAEVATSGIGGLRCWQERVSWLPAHHVHLAKAEQ